MKIFIFVVLTSVLMVCWAAPAPQQQPAPQSPPQQQPAPQSPPQPQPQQQPQTVNRDRQPVAQSPQQQTTTPVALLRSSQQTSPDGTYSFGFESTDGTKVQSTGNQKQIGPKKEDSGTVAKGSYTFTSPEGLVFTVDWIADENGFQASGDHIPKPINDRNP